MANYFRESIALLLLLQLASVSCIKIEDFQEGPCIVPKVDESFDLLWLANYAEWFFPIWSKYELYQWAAAISTYSFQNVTEDMAERSCMLLIIGGEVGATQTAFGGKKSTIDSSIADHGVFDWTETRSNGSPGFRGRTYITLTDNDKYYVSVSCWQAENQRSYTVHSNVKTLDQDSKNKIRAHLRSLGFEVTNNWLEMQYDDCIDLENPTKRKAPAAVLQPSNLQNVITDRTRFQDTQYGDNNNSNRPNRNPNSIELFFNIFRSIIDFLQHMSQNISRNVVRLVTRVTAQFKQG